MLQARAQLRIAADSSAANGKRHREARGSAGATGPSFEPMLLGFGLYLAWGTCMPQAQNALIGHGGTASGATSLMHALFLLLFALIANYGKRDLYSPKAVLALGIALSVAPLLRLAGEAATGTALGTALRMASLALEGAGRAGLFLLWVERFARHPQHTSWVALASSFLAVPLAYFAIAALPAPVAFAVALAMAPSSCALLWRCAARDTREAETTEGPGCTWRFPWRPAALMATFSFAHFMLLHVAGGSSAVGQLGNLAAAGVLLVACTAAFDRLDLHALYKLCLPLMLCALLMLAQGELPLGSAACMLSYASYNAFALLVLFVTTSICFRYGVRASWLAGIVESCGVLAHTAGSSLGGWLAGLQGSDPAAASAVIDAVAMVLVVLGLALLSEKDFSTTWGVLPVGTPRRASSSARTATKEPEGATTPPDENVPAHGSYYEDFAWRCARVARHYGLTHREEEVLALVAQGKTASEIEALLFISHNTAKGHLQHVYAKLGVHSREEAAATVLNWPAR